MKNLPRELTDTAQASYYLRDNPTFSLQSIEEIMKIVEEARSPPPASVPIKGFGWGQDDDEEEDIDAEVIEDEAKDEEDEYDKRVKEVHASGEYHIH